MGSKQPISSSISQIPSLDHKPQELSSSVLPDSTKYYNMREIHRQVLDSTSITMANMNPTGEKVAIKKIDKGYLINDFLKEQVKQEWPVQLRFGSSKYHQGV